MTFSHLNSACRNEPIGAYRVKGTDLFFMFREQKYTKPQLKSVIATLAVAGLAFFASQISPMVGYFLALLTLVSIIIASFTNSFLPTQAKKENILIFSLFWGLMLGLIVPILISTYLEGGLLAIWEIFSSED